MTTELLTVPTDKEGFLLNPEDWDRTVAVQIAHEEGINPVTPRHWEVIEFCRDDYFRTGESPTLRRITKASGVETKELYALFPKGPAKKVARISGLSKPKGCL
jgi:TusE/DsrC/DsvC family sulfur relay protein